MELLSKLKTLRQAVFTIRVTGRLTNQSLLHLNSQLAKARALTPTALGVIVNNWNGGAAQANLMRQRIQTFGKEHGCPVYTFAEDYAVGTGFIVLTAGNEIWAHPNSYVGGLGASQVTMRFKELAQYYGIKRKVWATSPNDLDAKFDCFKELTPEAKKWGKDVLDASQQNLIAIVESARKDKLKCPPEKREELLYNGDVFIAGKAVELGCVVNRLIDGLGSAKAFLKGKFPDIRLIDLSRENAFQAHIPASAR